MEEIIDNDPPGAKGAPIAHEEDAPTVSDTKTVNSCQFTLLTNCFYLFTGQPSH